MNLSAEVYLGTDNYVALELTDGGLPIAGGIGNLTRAVAHLTPDAGGPETVVDSNVAPTAFDWVTEGPASILRLVFGRQPIPPGEYRVRLDTFDDTPKRIGWTDPASPSVFTLSVLPDPGIA